MATLTSPSILSGLPMDTPILLALSGGADSVALLHMLLSLPIPLSVAHVDHGIRGEAAARDATFCQALAEKAGLPFYLLRADVPSEAKQTHMGLEEQARATRYAFFETVMREQHIPILATAHNATDNAETVLFRMARGTGLSGLCGIPPSRPFGGGVLIRPLLNMTKEDILSYCYEHSLTYVTDESNADTAFARNRIRHDVLPHLTKINAEAVRHISSLCRTLSEDEAYLTATARELWKRDAESNGQEGVSLALLNTLPAPLSHRILAMLFGDPPLSAKNREELMALARNATPHSSLDLPGGKRGCIENGRLVPCAAKAPLPKHTSHMNITLGATPLFGGEMLLVIDSEDAPYEMWESVKNIYKNATTIRINSDRIENGLFVRIRQEGDRILVRGQHKRLRKLQNELAVPLPLRHSLPILCDSEGLLWAPLTALRDGAKGDARLRVTLFY